MTSSARNPDHQAEFFLCLSRAFLPPMAASAWEGIAGYLAPDLRDIASALGRERMAEIDALEAALKAVPDHQALLLGYSSLFFAPPIKVYLNAGMYLDSALMGAHTMGMQEFYARNGVARSDDFKDMPDHLAIQFEFLAVLFARTAEAEDEATREAAFKAARDFMRYFMVPWLPTLARETMGKAGGEAGRMPYVHLAELARAEVEEALEDLLAAFPLTGEDLTVQPVAGGESAPLQLPPEATAEALDEMMQRLREAGLDTSHLEVDQRQRDFNLGMKPKNPVTLKKTSRQP